MVVLPAQGARTARVLDDSEEALVFAVVRGERITLGADDQPLAVDSCHSERRRYLAWCERARVLPRDLNS